MIYDVPLKITFDHISHHFRSICNFLFSQNGRRWPFWLTENHVRSHFSPFQINMQFLFSLNFFTKWSPAAILDDRKSLSITFLTISDQYATIFLVVNPTRIYRNGDMIIIGIAVLIVIDIKCIKKHDRPNHIYMYTLYQFPREVYSFCRGPLHNLNLCIVRGK